MKVESPRFKRCCFCIPLRRGILGWGYLKLALDLMAIGLLIFIYTIFSFGVSSSNFMALALSALYRIVDISFCILLIVACHKKAPKLLKCYYIYGFVELLLIIISTTILTYNDVEEIITWTKISSEDFSETVINVVATTAVYFLDIFVCVYVLLLVRSEIVKLQDHSLEMQFVNHAAEGDSRCVCTDTYISKNDSHDPTVQSLDDRHDPTVQSLDDRHDLPVQSADDKHNPTV